MCRHHRGNDCTAEIKRARQIGVAYLTPLGIGHVLHKTNMGNARVVDQHLDRASQRTLGLGDGAAHLVGIRNIGADGNSTRPISHFCGRGIIRAVQKCDGVSLGTKSRYQSPSDTARAARDEYSFHDEASFGAFFLFYPLL